MVKVLTGVQPGQVTEAEADVIAGAPAQQLQERVPQATSLDSLLEPTPAAPPAAAPEEVLGAVEEGVTAGLQAEEAIAAQREREAVPDIITRRDNPEVVAWQTKQSADQASTGPQTDGGLAARATNLATAFTAGGLHLGGLQSKHGGAAKEIASTVGALTPEGTLDRGFLQMMSVITEDTIAGLAFADGEAGVTLEGEVAPEEVQGQSAVTKAQGNKQLGDRIHREYQRYRNSQAGRPTDEYTDLQPEQATILGDMAKEMYFAANNTDGGKRMLVRGAAPDGQTTFTLTKHGSDRLREGTPMRKKLFPKQHVRPSKTPLPEGRLVGEGLRYTRARSGRTGAVAGADVLHEAMRNLNQVANVVDPQRLKILFATALPVLQEKVGADHPFANINHVGQNKINKLAAKLEDPSLVPEEYAKLVDDLAQAIFGITQERNGANHLTYYMQTFNGRIAPQQSLFDPTSSKTVRFVTRNAVPAAAAPGSRIEKNLRQMYAMMLVKGADALLPEGREAALERATPQLVKWGKELRAALGQFPDSLVEEIAQAISDGTALNDPNFPQVPDVGTNLTPELVDAINSKGEDGQAFIDGVLDFTAYYENKLKGKPHFSFFNAYMDGKTNGLASNGIQMGSERVAYKTGVLRSQDQTLLDNDKDIRDDLKDTLLDLVDGGFDGAVGPELTGPLHNIATTLFSVRDLNKATTMTFGYGKELDSFKHDIDEYLAELEQGDPAVAQDVSTLINGMGDRQTLIDTLHGKYVGGLENALDKNALKSRALMRSAAYLFALSNEIFTIESAVGSEIAMGGTESTGQEGPGVEYSIQRDAGPADETGFVPREKIAEPVARQFGTERTAAAVKTRADAEADTVEGEVGGHAYGGAVPAPVQSLDAATVALTASGKSWGKLRSASNGNPYLHTIYDAFKVDAMGYDVVLDEVNKNWLESSMNWSYLEQTKDAIDQLRSTFNEKYGNRANNDPLTEGEARQMLWFLEVSKTDRGKPTTKNLNNKMRKLIELPDNADPEVVRDLGNESAKNIVAAMKNAGYNVYAPPAQPTVGHLKAFMKAFSDEVQLAPRLGRMINETNNNKKKLGEKIRRDKHKVYQYYAH